MAVPFCFWREKDSIYACFEIRMVNEKTPGLKPQNSKTFTPG